MTASAQPTRQRRPNWSARRLLPNARNEPRDGRSGKRSSRRATPGSPSAKLLKLRGKNARRQIRPQRKQRKPPLGKLPSSWNKMPALQGMPSGPPGRRNGALRRQPRKPNDKRSLSNAERIERLRNEKAARGGFRGRTACLLRGAAIRQPSLPGARIDRQVDKLLFEFRIASPQPSHIPKRRGLLTIMRSFLIRTEHS